MDDVYPDELDSLVDGDGNPDATKIKTWFDHKGFGDSNARQMAATYVMVASKQIPEPPASSGEPKKKAAPKTKAASQASASKDEAKQQSQTPAADPPHPPGRTDNGPNIHLDIQIHIPADATPEQIDQIFSSMARHLYAK